MKEDEFGKVWETRKGLLGTGRWLKQGWKLSCAEKTPCWGAVLTSSRALWLGYSILPWFPPHPHSTPARSFSSPGGKVNFIENKFYKLLYGDGKDKTALSMWTCCVLGTSPQESASAKWVRPFLVSLLFSGPQSLWGGAVVLCSLWWAPGLPVSSSLHLPGLRPLAMSPRPPPS